MVYLGPRRSDPVGPWAELKESSREGDDAIVKICEPPKARRVSADFELGHEHVVFVFEDVAVEHVDPSEVRELGSHCHAAP